jgi:hypothetical protein
VLFIFKLQVVHVFLNRELDPKTEVLNILFVIFSLCIADLEFLYKKYKKDPSKCQSTFIPVKLSRICVYFESERTIQEKYTEKKIIPKTGLL